MAYITLSSALSLCSSGSFLFLAVASDIGVKLHDEYCFQVFDDLNLNDKQNEIYLQFQNLKKHKGSRHFQNLWNRVLDDNQDYLRSLDIVFWSEDTIMKVGEFLLKILVDTFEFDTTNPLSIRKLSNSGIRKKAFKIMTTYADSSVKKQRQLCLDAEFITAMLNHELYLSEALSRQLPMIVPPIPYTDFSSGGYLLHFNRCIVRQPPSRSYNIKFALKDTDPESLKPVLDALNTLSNTKWMVNTRILDVMLDVWDRNGDEKLRIIRSHDFTPVEKRNRFVRWKFQRSIANRFSISCDVQYRLLVAYSYRNIGLYLPHNIDFRGRAYPIPLHLNHMGDDVCRGLLVFYEKKPLGKAGLRWLKIHLANVYGHSKAKFTLVEREKFTEAHLPQILASAENPMGTSWWKEAESPWQTLATCFELAEALKSDNPEEFMTGLPVHQDGSCNGLQHYAALSGDELGALYVNLTPSENPKDIYETIAERVKEAIDIDVNDPASPNHAIAQLTRPYISRKIVKHPVMTSVYGARLAGTSSQIEQRLKEISKFPTERYYESSRYIARKVEASLGEIFEAANSIKSWLGTSAGIISQLDKPVRWVSPIGLPVLQPYYKFVEKRLVDGQVLRISFVTTAAKKSFKKTACSLDVRKQKASFPPNFIHSLDSSHMFRTALACNDKNITFAAVHDSFWTHPCDVPLMNKIIREEFVNMHKQDIMTNLKAYFENLYKKPFPPLPKRGSFDINLVQQSTYFFS
ncbi:uncharacterized protein LOC135145743 [Zophobas morio]|uniref:uncharacterized protein LOC135145743 n=1 Tax=Zophobas morio TaxID=2755281 RepID=UPI0030833E32